DIDLERKKLSVCATLQNIGGKMELAEPKTAGSRRQISLLPQAVAALREHRVKQNEERLHVGACWQDSKLIFANQLGGPMDGTNLLKYWFYPLTKQAGLPRIRFHDLRHTAATLLLRQGVNPKIVSEMLGHAKVQITLDTYSHVLPDMQDVAVLAMEKALFSRA
ncbi:MAG TPA: site-specific integrase, partial [Ktedonobacterales bacterium]